MLYPAKLRIEKKETAFLPATNFLDGTTRHFDCGRRSTATKQYLGTHRTELTFAAPILPDSRTMGANQAPRYNSFDQPVHLDPPWKQTVELRIACTPNPRFPTSDIKTRLEWNGDLILKIKADDILDFDSTVSGFSRRPSRKYPIRVGASGMRLHVRDALPQAAVRYCGKF